MVTDPEGSEATGFTALISTVTVMEPPVAGESVEGVSTVVVAMAPVDTVSATEDEVEPL
jgi:hypothetical protein